MVRLAWHATGERFFETGTDRGVLYLEDTPGVPWVGLVSVEETSESTTVEEYYLDGRKRLNYAINSDFKAKLEAYASPREFDVCDGILSLARGLYATQQQRVPFGLSYRTSVGNDTQGVNHAYKLHLVYNALASPPTRGYKTANNKPAPITLSWGIQTTPELSTSYRPSAHFTIDTRRMSPEDLILLEDKLYGTETTDPELPSPAALLDLIT